VSVKSAQRLRRLLVKPRLTLFAFFPPQALPSDARGAAHRWQRLGANVKPVDGVKE
jgi:hypothetical protein